MLAEKISAIQKTLQESELDYLIIGNTGHQIHDDVLYWLLLETLELGIMVIPKIGTATLYAVPFEVETLKHKRDAIAILPYTAVADILESIPPKSTIGYRPSAMPASLYKTIETGGHFELRALAGDEIIMAKKLPKEISRIRQAAKLADIIFGELTKNWSAYYSEADVAHAIGADMAKRGVEASFPPIVASGHNAANPHHKPTFDKLQPGFCVIDMGVRFKGYCSDMTRTIYLGSPDKRDIELYNTVLHAQTKTINMVKIGVTTKQLDEHCRTLLGAKLNNQFIHALGHGLGSQVHEWPSVSGKKTIELREHMVITIEPGVYSPHQYGIRIEDDVLLTEQGPEILTKTEKKLLIL